MVPGSAGLVEGFKRWFSGLNPFNSPAPEEPSFGRAAAMLRSAANVHAVSLSEGTRGDLTSASGWVTLAATAIEGWWDDEGHMLLDDESLVMEAGRVQFALEKAVQEMLEGNW